MKRPVFVTCLALAMAWSAAALADENDFIGYEYSQNYQRDYDRGFFFGAEAWFANPRNLHFEPALANTGAGAPVGGRLLDVDFDYEVSPRVWLGWQGNRRVGRFTLSYWDFNEEQERSELGTGFFTATGTHPVRGDVTTDSFRAAAEVDAEYAALEWRKDFGQGRRFTSYFTAALHAWELEYATESEFFNGADAGSSVRIRDFTNTQGLGGKVGLGGAIFLNDRFSIGANGAIGWVSAEQDYLYLDENPAAASVVGFIERDDTELSLLTLEGDLNFHLRAAGGFEIDWGYRYLNFEDAIAEDRFVDNAAKFVTLEQTHDLAFEGPYLNFRWITGRGKVDSDGDGVLDAYDDCIDTPAGALVNEAGCPSDGDEDGVYDGIDRCPGTQFGTRVDEFGCGVDSDGDGVADGLDLCPNTHDCAIVDPRGCPKDSDGDGVSNGCDACPGTAGGMVVDMLGCVVILDADGDTVPDAEDRCPNTERGATVDERGCALLVSLKVNFALDSDQVLPTDLATLDRIGQALVADGGTFEVAGHTDSQASYEYNLDLSQRRAATVMRHLVQRGVPAGRLTAVGYSEGRPIADNSTMTGRAANRRVEIHRR